MVTKQSVYGWWKLIILLPLVVSVAACGMLFGDDSVSCEGHITGDWQATPPPSATNFTERCDEGAQPSYDASFTMSAEDVESFMQSTRVTDWQTNIGAGVLAEEAERAQSYRAGNAGDGIFYLEMLIDTSDAAQYRVYYSVSYVE